MGVIKQLKQFITGTNIFPITKTNAVYDDTVGRLDKFMQDILVGADMLETETEDIPRDADTLGGHMPEYFATKEDLDDLSISANEITKINIINVTSSHAKLLESNSKAIVKDGICYLQIVAQGLGTYSGWSQIGQIPVVPLDGKESYAPCVDIINNHGSALRINTDGGIVIYPRGTSTSTYYAYISFPCKNI